MKNVTFIENTTGDLVSDIIIDDDKHTSIPLKLSILESSFENPLCSRKCSSIFMKNIRITADSLIEQTMFLDSQFT